LPGHTCDFPTDSRLFPKPDGLFWTRPGYMSFFLFHCSYWSCLRPLQILVTTPLAAPYSLCGWYHPWLVGSLLRRRCFLRNVVDFTELQPRRVLLAVTWYIGLPMRVVSFRKFSSHAAGVQDQWLVQGTCWPMKRTAFVQISATHTNYNPSQAEFGGPYHCLGCWEITNKSSRARPLSLGLLGTVLA
jgi:hypothetical protein